MNCFFISIMQDSKLQLQLLQQKYAGLLMESHTIRMDIKAYQNRLDTIDTQIHSVESTMNKVLAQEQRKFGKAALKQNGEKNNKH